MGNVHSGLSVLSLPVTMAHQCMSVATGHVGAAEVESGGAALHLQQH